MGIFLAFRRTSTTLVDLAYVCSAKGISDPKMLQGRGTTGLDDLVRLTLDLFLSKDEAVRLPNWDNELSAAQRTYAGLDAWIGLEVYRRVDKGSALGLPTTWNDFFGTPISLIHRGQLPVAHGKVVRWLAYGVNEMIETPDGQSPTL